MRYSADAPTKNYVLGPKRSRGTIPSPGNWTTKCIAAAWLVSFIAFIFLGCGTLFLIPFFDFHRGIQGVPFSTNCAVACPPVSLPSTSQTQLGRAVLGSNLFVLIFCQILGTMWRISLFATFTSGSLIPPLVGSVTIVRE